MFTESRATALEKNGRKHALRYFLLIPLRLYKNGALLTLREIGRWTTGVFNAHKGFGITTTTLKIQLVRKAFSLLLLLIPDAGLPDTFSGRDDSQPI